jgi:chromosome segregation and condensation protein ScpB
MPLLRLGVKLTPTKARIFDAVQFRGGDGIPLDTLSDIIGMKHNTLKAHIHQINEIIADRGYRIYGRGGYVRLTRTKKKTIIDKLAKP